MFYGAKSSSVKTGQTETDYICFGRGDKPLLLIPGLGDGLRTVKGSHIPLALMYRIFAKDYKVYVFSRKNHIEEGYSTRDMAEDLYSVMENLSIRKAHIVGISQGGMIAQYLAIDYPHMVDKLVIGVSIARQNQTIEEVVKKWISLAENKDYKNLLIDITEKSYTDKRLKLYRLLYPILTRLGRPDDFHRFIIQAQACISHDSYHELDKIKSPTLIIGGGKDKILGSQASREMVDKIPNSCLHIYEGLGHGLYEEAKDFNKIILDFLKEDLKKKEG